MQGVSGRMAEIELRSIGTSKCVMVNDRSSSDPLRTGGTMNWGLWNEVAKGDEMLSSWDSKATSTSIQRWRDEVLQWQKQSGSRCWYA